MAQSGACARRPRACAFSMIAVESRSTVPCVTAIEIRKIMAIPPQTHFPMEERYLCLRILSRIAYMSISCKVLRIED